MIKLLLLAIVPFVTEHRNVVPKTEVTTNFYGSVTGVVDKAYIQSRIGTGIITDVRTNGVSVVSNNIANIIEVDPTVPEWAKKPNPPQTDLTPAINYTDSATNAVMTDLTAQLAGKASRSDVKLVPVYSDWIFSDGKPHYLQLEYIESDNPYWTYIIDNKLADEHPMFDSREDAEVALSLEFHHHSGDEPIGTTATRSVVAYKLGNQTPELLPKSAVIDPASATTTGKAADALKVKTMLDAKANNESPRFSSSISLDDASGTSSIYSDNIYFSSGGKINYLYFPGYDSSDTNIFVGSLFDILATRAWTDYHYLKKESISETNPAFSNAVLAVGLNIDTNSVAVLNDIADTFGGFPIEGTATTVGGLLAALAAAAAWLKKNKVGSFASVGGASATVENGVAKLDDFFKESNGLLNGRLVYERNATGLKDRAFNALTFDGTEYNLSTALAAVTPTASGQPRDLLIVATATAATTISFTAGTIKGDKPTIDGSGTWLITLTEYTSGVWYCRQIKMEDAA